VFPLYYSFTQDLTERHQGKVTGVLGCCCWHALALWQLGVGELIHRTGSYAPAFIIAGLAPLGGFAALMLFWGPTEESVKRGEALELAPVAQREETRVMPAEQGIVPVVAAIKAEG
jgi:hypothetical protein